jgi:hypothetical protein
MNPAHINDVLLQVAKECLERGPGFSQESVVLRGAAERLRIDPGNDEEQQELLTCWHDLFREGVLSWGYNVDNPNAPFFHIRARTKAIAS